MNRVFSTSFRRVDLVLLQGLYTLVKVVCHLSSPFLQVFTSMALFSILISPLNAFPWVINGLMEAWVSTKRIQAFLKLSELDWDQYYSDMHDTLANTPPDDDRASTSSPGSDSQQNLTPEKAAPGESTAEVCVHASLQDSSPREERRREPVLVKMEGADEEEEIYVGSQSPVGASREDSGNIYAAFEERRSRGRKRQRRHRVIVVRHGVFTWSRKDGERASGSGEDGDGGDGEGGAEKKEEDETKPSTLEETADSTEIASPVEWMLSDVNFTIFSVSITLVGHCNNS